MKATCVFLLLWGHCLNMSAQYVDPIWARYDVVSGTTIHGSPFLLVDSSHNPIVCGNDYHPGPLNAFLTIKYDANGNLLWQRKFDTIANEDVTSCVTDKDDAVYVGGNTNQNSITGTLPGTIVIKYAANGDSLWAYRFSSPTSGATYLSKLLLDSAHNIVVFGLYSDTVAQKGGLFAAKLSSDGQVLWSTTFLNPIFSIGGPIAGHEARWIGDRWLFWGRRSADGGNRYLAWQISPDGLTLGEGATEFDPDNGTPNTQHIDQEGNLYVTGWNKYRIVKYSITGQKVWEYQKDSPPSIPSLVGARLTCIETNKEGEVFIAGIIRADTPKGHIPVITKLSASGTILWEHSFVLDDIPFANPTKMAWVNESTLLISGQIYFDMDNNLYEFFIAAYNDNGFVQGGVTDLEGNRNYPRSLLINKDILYVVGTSGRITPADPNRQVLCKYALNDVVSTRAAPRQMEFPALTLWPNPAGGQVRVSLPENTAVNGEQVLELTDMAGRVLRTERVQQWGAYFDLRLDGIPAGAYIVVLKQNGQPTHLGRGVKK